MTFLNPLRLIAIFLLVCVVFETPLEAANKPNIVFILTDDHRYDAFSFMDHPVVETPHLDRLRNEGVHFENAFVTTSICSPSRATILTSTYAHEHGVIDHSGREINFEEMTTFPAELQQAGYHTGLIGKWHMAREDNPRPGFDYWLSFRGQGVYNNPKLDENGRDFQEKGYITDILTDYAVRYIRKRTKEKQPFCLYLSHKAMHGPFTPPDRHKNLYRDKKLPEPASWNDTFETKPEWQRYNRGARVVRSSREAPESLPAKPWHKRRAYMKRVIPDYLRTANAVDEGVGRILDELEKLGVLDNTLVIYMGDNGFFLGEHRLLDKRYFYEESLRVPLIARYPGVFEPGSTIDAIVLNLDIAPTILDAAGVEQPGQFRGRSLIELAQGAPQDSSSPVGSAATSWRDQFFYSYWQEYMPNIPTMLGLRQERFKYVTYPFLDDIPELYDLENDPYEMTNLAQDPAYADKVEEMQTALKQEADAIGFTFDVPDPHKRYSDWPDETGVLLARKEETVFNGNKRIPLDAPKTVNPIQLPYRIEARFKPEADGTLLSHGNEHAGYAIVVEDGIPRFFLTKEQSVYILEGKERALGKWVEVRADIRPFYTTWTVNGTEQAKWPIRAPFIEPVKGPIVLGGNTLKFSKRFGIKLDPPDFEGTLDSLTITRPVE